MKGAFQQRTQATQRHCVQHNVQSSAFQLRHKSTQSYTTKKLSSAVPSLHEYQHFYDFYIWCHLFFYRQQS